MPYWIKIPLLLFVALVPLCIILGGYVILGKINSQPLVCTEGNSRFVSKQTIPQIRANGLAWGDYDNDGWDDLLISSYPSGLEQANFSPVKMFKNINGKLMDYTDNLFSRNISAVSGFFADYDNDGWLDLFLLEGVVDINAISFNQGFYLRPRVLRNVAGKSFEDMTGATGLSNIVGKGNRGSYALSDFDIDGDLDFVLVIRGYVQLLYNFHPDGDLLKTEKIIGTLGRERIICGQNEVEQVLGEEPRIASSIEKSFGSREKFLESKGCVYAENTPAYDPIPPFWELKTLSTIFLIVPGEIRSFRNDNGTFVDVGFIAPPYQDYFEGFADVAPGLPWQGISYKLRQPIVTDLNNDNLPDLFIVNESGRNVILQNEGGFHFKDVSSENKIGFFGAGRGAVQGDILHQGKLDLIMSNRGNAFFFMRGEDGGLHFNDKRSVNRFGLGEGLALIDSDNDGWEDLIFANGREETRQSRKNTARSFYKSLLHPLKFTQSTLYYNHNGEFYDHTKDLCIHAKDVYTIGVSDINSDGYEDLALGTLNVADNENVGVFIAQNSGGDNHYVKVKLHGKASNSFGIGATITVITGDGSKETKFVGIGEGLYSQNSLIKTFGLGKQTTPVTIEVKWPSGKKQIVHDVTVDTLRVIEESELQ